MKTLRIATALAISAVILWAAGTTVPDFLRFKNMTAPSSPPSGTVALYANGDQLCSKSSTGTVACGLGGGGLSDPTTTKGDIIVHGPSALTRLGVGTDGYALVSRSSATNGIDWEPVGVGNLSATGTYYLTDGSSNYYGPVIPLTPPPSTGSFTGVNMTNCSFTAVGSAVKLEHNAGATNDQCYEYIAAPSTPYSITAAFSWDFPSENFYGIGVTFEDSVSGKALGCYLNVGFVASLGFKFSAFGFPSISSIASGSQLGNAPTLIQTNFPLVIKARADGTNLSCSYSVDGGQTMRQTYSASKTAYLSNAPNRVGISVGINNANYPAAITVLSWIQGS